MWNLEKWYRRSYLQSKNRDTYVGNKYIDNEGERRVMGINGRLGLTHTVLMKSESEIHSVVSDSFWPQGLYSPGQNIGMGSLFLPWGSSQPRDQKRSPKLQVDSWPGGPQEKPKYPGLILCIK